MTDKDMLHQETGHQAEEALCVLIETLSDGLRHGFFDYSVSCEMIQGRKRVLIINAGKKYRFTIPEDQISEVNASRLMGFERGKNG